MSSKSYHTICYISKGAENLSTTDIDHLMQNSSIANGRREITGILLYEMGSFFQVLEGEKDIITNLYNTILKDPRHKEIYSVFDRGTNDPVFKGYNSKFNVVKTYDDLSLIKTYLDKNRTHPTTEKLGRLLTPFLMMKELHD